MSGEDHVRAILRTIGEDPDREGLQKTPERVTRALQFLTKGYQEDPAAILNSALFSEEYSEMIVLKDLDFFTLCEHHMLPFFGKAHVAYIPSNKILGLSKLARLFEVFARRLQVQERLTTQVAHSLMTAIDPQGVGVVVEAEDPLRGAKQVATTALLTFVALETDGSKARVPLLRLSSDRERRAFQQAHARRDDRLARKAHEREDWQHLVAGAR